MSLATSESRVFAGTDGAGVYASSDGQKIWKMINSGLENTQVLALAAVGEFLFAGTGGDGVWRLPLAEVKVTWNRTKSAP